MPLTLEVKGKDLFDATTEEFIYTKDQTVELEHCLLSIARWESKWKKPFIETFAGKKKQMTIKEVQSYIQCMCMNNADMCFVYCLTPEQNKAIFNYISEDQSATKITREGPQPARGNEILTSELIYYYMSQVPLPFEICERWHFSRLMKTLEIAGIKSQPEKKMSRSAWGSKQAALNKLRRAKTGSLG